MKNKFNFLIFGLFVLFMFSNCSRKNSDKFSDQTEVEKPVREKQAPVEAAAEAPNSGATKRAVSSGDLSPEVKAIKDRKIQNNGIMLKKGMKLEHKKQAPKKDN